LRRIPRRQSHYKYASLAWQQGNPLLAKLHPCAAHSHPVAARSQNKQQRCFADEEPVDPNPGVTGHRSEQEFPCVLSGALFQNPPVCKVRRWIFRKRKVCGLIALNSRRRENRPGFRLRRRGTHRSYSAAVFNCRLSPCVAGDGKNKKHQQKTAKDWARRTACLPPPLYERHGNRVFAAGTVHLTRPKAICGSEAGTPAHLPMCKQDAKAQRSLATERRRSAQGCCTCKDVSPLEQGGEIWVDSFVPRNGQIESRSVIEWIHNSAQRHALGRVCVSNHTRARAAFSRPFESTVLFWSCSLCSSPRRRRGYCTSVICNRVRESPTRSSQSAESAWCATFFTPTVCPSDSRALPICAAAHNSRQSLYRARRKNSSFETPDVLDPISSSIWRGGWNSTVT